MDARLPNRPTSSSARRKKSSFEVKPTNSGGLVGAASGASGASRPAAECRGEGEAVRAGISAPRFAATCVTVTQTVEVATPFLLVTVVVVYAVEVE